MNDDYEREQPNQEDMDRDILIDTDDITYDDEAIGLPHLSIESPAEREAEKRANIENWKREFIKEN